jgi:hypothetical protein
MEFRDGAPPAPAVVIGSLNQWVLNQTREFADVTAFQDANKVWVPGPKDTGGTIAGFYDMAGTGPGVSEPLFDAAEGDVPVKMALIPNSLDPGNFWEGLGYMDLSVTVATSGAVTLAGNWKAGGPWTRTSAALLARAAAMGRAA